MERWRHCLYQQGGAVGVATGELCLTQPEWVQDVHTAYLRAGAQVIETNTYAANREALMRYGLEGKTTRLNRAAVQVARQAIEQVETDAFVAGSIGSILAGRVRSSEIQEYRDAFEEHAIVLLHEGVDGIILETFYDLEELLLALDVLRPLIGSTNTPIIAQLALLEPGRTRDGYDLNRAFVDLQNAGADMVGLNCRLGPAEILRSLERTMIPEGLPFSAFPNAGRLGLVDGEYRYASGAEYFGESAIRLWEQGAGLIGGCCGTTPEHIRAIADALQGRERHVRINPAPQSTVVVVEPERTVHHVRTELPEQPTVVDLVKQRHTVIVEFDTPRDLDIEKYIEGSTSPVQSRCRRDHPRRQLAGDHADEQHGAGLDPQARNGHRAGRPRRLPRPQPDRPTIAPDGSACIGDQPDPRHNRRPSPRWRPARRKFRVRRVFL